MKLVRFSPGGSEEGRFGVLTERGILDAATCWDLHSLATGESADPPLESPVELLDRGEDALDRLRKAVDWAANEGAAAPVSPDRARLLAPIARPPKIICIGMNYRDHCAEQGHDVPDRPVVFSKFPTAVLGPGEPIILPRISEKVDYEAELGVVVGRGGRHIPEQRALEHVGGYLNFNDVSARDLQFGDGQWVRGKSCDTFAPMGPALVTADEIPDPQGLEICCRVNGETMQRSNTDQMIFSVAFLISFLSDFMTLEVGDVVATGTPPGVGIFRKPPRLLRAGDTVEIEVEGLGVLSNPVRDEADSA